MKSDLGYHLKDGLIHPVIIDKGFKIALPGSAADYSMESGNENSDWVSFTIHAVAEIADTLTPGISWWCSPTMSGDEDGNTMSGFAWCKGKLAWVSTGYSPTSILFTCYHEAWHLLKKLPAPEEFYSVDDAIDRGCHYLSEYLNSRIKGQARTFANFAMYLREGGRTIIDSRTPEVAIFYKALTGKIGRRGVVNASETETFIQRIIGRAA